MTSALIVDDSMFIRKILSEMLKKTGIDKIDEAGDGFQAVNLAKNNSYKLIFMDIKMPKLTGLDAVRQIRPFSPGTKIIIVTSVDQKMVIKEAEAAGADEYIVKPFDFQTIQNIVNKYGN